jgi:hypothetical protein
MLGIAALLALISNHVQTVFGAAFFLFGFKQVI